MVSLIKEAGGNRLKIHELLNFLLYRLSSSGEMGALVYNLHKNVMIAAAPEGIDE